MTITSKKLKKYLDNAQLAIGITREAIRAKRNYGVSCVWGLKRGISLVRSHRFAPDEAHNWGLFNPAISENELSGFVSKRALSNVQNSLNPVSWYYVTEDKGIFYRYCQALGLPIPDLYAIAFKDQPSWTRSGDTPCTGNDWARFLRSLNSDGLIIKPCRSLFGQGVEVYSIENGVFSPSKGSNLSHIDLGERIESEKLRNGLILQERIFNHPNMSDLGNTDHLQTVRIITYLDTEGEVNVLSAFLKVIRGDNITDNFAGGRSGNIVMSLDRNTGAPVEVLQGEKKFHTVTRCKWEDFYRVNEGFSSSFRVPRWGEVLSLSREVAHAFQPLRLVGWDIAVTPSRPVLLEGNYRAGPFPTSDLRANLSPAFEAHRRMIQ